MQKQVTKVGSQIITVFSEGLKEAHVSWMPWSKVAGVVLVSENTLFKGFQQCDQIRSFPQYGEALQFAKDHFKEPTN